MKWLKYNNLNNKRFQRSEMGGWFVFCVKVKHFVPVWVSSTLRYHFRKNETIAELFSLCLSLQAQHNNKFHQFPANHSFSFHPRMQFNFPLRIFDPNALLVFSLSLSIFFPRDFARIAFTCLRNLLLYCYLLSQHLPFPIFSHAWFCYFYFHLSFSFLPTLILLHDSFLL